MTDDILLTAFYVVGFLILLGFAALISKFFEYYLDPEEKTKHSNWVSETHKVGGIITKKVPE